MAWQTVAKVGDLQPGTAKAVDVGDKRIALCNVDGEYYAIEDVCTHDGGPLDQGVLIDNLIECPRHGAMFDVTTGKAMTLPAVFPVDTYDVRVEGQEIQVQV